LHHLFLCLGCFVEHYCIPKIFWMFICGFYYFILPLSFWDKNGKSFYFWIGCLFTQVICFCPRMAKERVFFSFIGYILVDKNNPYSRHWLFRDTVIQSQILILLQNIYSSMERIIQGKICNILLKKGKILETLLMSKTVFHCDQGRPKGNV
jgi:hypothetical protein